MVADNNLSFFATKDLNEMELGFDPTIQGDIYVYIDKGRTGTPSHPYLLKIKRDSTNDVVSPIIKTYPEQNSCDPNVLTTVLNDVRGIAKSNNQNIDNLVLWSHGSGWLPINTSLSSADSLIKSHKQHPVNSTLSFGLDEDDLKSKYNATEEMDISALAKTLDNWHFNTITFDACFMGGVEVAYALRHSCNYIISSPAEISSTGFPYDTVTKLFQSNSDPKEIAEKYAEYYEQQKGDFKSYTISVINTSQLENLSLLIADIHKQFKNDASDTSKAYSPIKLQQYDRLNGNLFFDLKSFYSNLISAHQNDELNAKFNSLWTNTILFEKHSQKIMGSLELKEVNGLSVYIPKSISNNSKVNEYYKTLSWYKATNNKFWSN